MPFALSRRHRSLAALLIAVAVLAAPQVLPAAEKRPITETDLFKFVWTADPQISPDGKQVVYVRVTINEKKEGYDTALWTVPTDGSEPPRPFTSGPRDRSPRWSPDGTRLAFVRAPEKGDAQIYLISTRGGEAVALTELPQGAGNPVWSPDGKSIVFDSAANAKDLEKWRKQKKEKDKAQKDDEKKDKGEKADEERESDVRVITRAVYRFNGGGYADRTHLGHVWTVAVPADGAKAPEPKQITSGPLGEGGQDWSPDGSTIYFVADRFKEPYYEEPDNSLYAIPANGGEPREVFRFHGGLDDYYLSPDGRWVAFTGFANPDKPRSYNQSDLFVIGTAAGSQARNLTPSYNGDIGDGIGSDQHPPRGGSPHPIVWSRDGRSLYVVTAELGRANLARIDVATGAIQPITRGDQEVVSFSATPDGSRMALVLSTPLVLGDLYSLDTATGKLTAIARPNQELFSQLNLTPPEEVVYKSFDGREVHGFVQKPPDFDASKKYPLILNIHGGPHSAYGYTFFHEMQWMAARGYVVIYPNPRGSSTYGQDFGNVIQYEFPGDDAKDLLAGVDEMVKRGIADPEAAGRDGRQRRRHPHQLDRDPDRSLRRRRGPALDLGLGGLLVHGGLHPLPSHLVPRRTVGRSRGFRPPLAHHAHSESHDASDAHRRRSRLPHSARSRRRADVPCPQVPEEAGGDGALPGREPRAFPLGKALAPHRTPAAHRGVVGQVSAGEEDGCLRRAVRGAIRKRLGPRFYPSGPGPFPSSAAGRRCPRSRRSSPSESGTEEGGKGWRTSPALGRNRSARWSR